jgi:MoaA/NifB/PqqE/SkfB family radical SAM enzyme
LGYRPSHELGLRVRAEVDLKKQGLDVMAKARELFLERPYLSARQLCQQSGASLAVIREVFRQLGVDGRVQAYLRSWGPAQGYSIRVLQEYILNAPERIEAVHRDTLIFPSVLELHLGPACPCACVFCFSKGESSLASECASYRPGPDARLLDSTQVLSIVHTLAEHGCEVINLSGGLEPFSSPVTVQVLDQMPEQMRAYVFTNGVPTRLSDEVLERVVQRAHQLRFSIHAATPETYSVVQMPHRSDGQASFRRVVDRVKSAISCRDRLLVAGKKAAEIGVTFLTVPSNCDELEDALLMWAELGVDRFSIGNDALEENAHTGVLTHTQKAKVQEVSKRYQEIADAGGLNGMRVRPSRESVQSALPAAQKCYAPLGKVVVDPYGHLWTCCMRAHPFMQAGNFHLGVVKSGKEFEQLLRSRHRQPPLLRDVPLGFHCRACTEYEYVTNVWMQKLLDDLDYGVPLQDQPFGTSGPIA